MCVYAYITELSTRLSVSQSAPLEYHSPSLPFSSLLLSSLLSVFFNLFSPQEATAGLRRAVDEFEEDTRNGFPFTSDTTRVFQRHGQRLRDKIHSLSVGAGERLSRKLRSPLEACRHTPHSSRARHERLATVRMRQACRAVQRVRRTETNGPPERATLRVRRGRIDGRLYGANGNNRSVVIEWEIP